MNDTDKPFFKESEQAKEGDLLTWLLVFCQAWEREFHGILANAKALLMSDEKLKVILMEIKAKFESARDEIADIIVKENKK